MHTSTHPPQGHTTFPNTWPVLCNRQVSLWPLLTLCSSTFVYLDDSDLYVTLLNRRVFRTIHCWHDASIVDIEHAPNFCTLESLTRTHFAKLLNTITRTNPSVITDFLQQKQFLLFLREYHLNPSLLAAKRQIVPRGRTPNRIRRLLSTSNRSLFDYALGFEPSSNN